MENLLTFNLAEKKAIMKMLEIIAISDGRIVSQETKYSAQIAIALGLSAEQSKEISTLNPIACLETLEKMDALSKQKAVAIMMGMVLADDEADNQETAIFSFICYAIKTELPDGSYARILVEHLIRKSYR